ncbi:hypothetical protein [Streptomyces sp. N35]|uniref:hypothetical protein n=1 Tax=Streptomyces sp. N35 TaxID=2795730 RepID=UPI0018F59814|nr:hypothetical protein [Streptomyces sp. N35]
MPVHQRKDEIVSRAWAQALAMTRGDGDRADLVAAALEAHRALSRGFKQHVPVTALVPGGAASGLAAFVAVYATCRQEHRPPGPSAALSFEER